MNREKNATKSKREISSEPKGQMVIWADGLGEEVLLQLRELLRKFAGNMPVAFYFTKPRETCLRLAEEYWIDGARLRDFCSQAEILVGKGRINPSRS
jgi:hypothetical protein